MKISLNWVFDHIDGNVHDVDVEQLVNTFIKTTAEIEEWRKVFFKVDDFTFVQVIKITDEFIEAYSPELKENYTLPVRSDVFVDLWYLVECKEKQSAWATIHSLGGTKDSLLAAIFVEESLRTGSWKKTVELSDYIIEIDNKSINHRPDLWGHRGIAREIAAILNLQLKSIDTLLAYYSNTNIIPAQQGKTGDFSVAIESVDACKRFAALYVESIQNQQSSLDMVMRLSRLDSKAIDYVVDCTNYVMFDLGYPMHAFDAQSLQKKAIVARHAHAKEKLTLLDNETIELTSDDIVIADGDHAVSLAGVMGGATTSIHTKTKSLLLEVANFDAATIRRTAVRHKKRTDASMRFEKSLDPNHINNPILRFLFLLDQQKISYNSVDELIVLGNMNPVITIDVSHAKIEQLLGITISTDHVQAILKKLSFNIAARDENGHFFYTIEVPSFRATKDIAIAEDIIEEIGRYVGYDAIAQVMPSSHLIPSDLSRTYATRIIKRLLSSGLLMRELYGYSFFDESFLREISWDPQRCVEIKNPISENYTRLVNSLQPHLLKAVADNSLHHDQLRFYEWGHVWHDDNNILEKKSISGIFFDKNKSLDFYEGKSLVSRLFKELYCEVSWQSNDDICYPWLSVHQSARVMHNDICIGVVGMLEENVVNLLSTAGGSAFVFEFDGDYLINYKRPITRFTQLPKYPTVQRDISIMVPLAVKVDAIINTIKQVDFRIKIVSLVDFFTKKEWDDQKSITFRVEMRDDQKTFEHAEVESIWNNIIAVLQGQGAIIR